MALSELQFSKPKGIGGCAGPDWLSNVNVVNVRETCAKVNQVQSTNSLQWNKADLLKKHSIRLS
jgi:hypothetical protein